MRYKAIIEGKEYPLPEIIYDFNKEGLDEYLFEDEEGKYIDFDMFSEEDTYDNLDIISYQCSNTIGTIVLDDEKALQRYNEIGSQIRTFDKMASMNHEKGNDERAKQNLLEGMKLELDFYEKELELEKLGQNKGSR